MVNIGREGENNAFFYPPPFGPEGTGVVAFGAWDDGTPLVSADIVAHEVMHGVTHFLVSRRTGDGLLNNAWGHLGPTAFTLDGRTFRCGESLVFRTGPDANRAFRFACEDDRFLLLANHGGALAVPDMHLFAISSLADLQVDRLRLGLALQDNPDDVSRSFSRLNSKVDRHETSFRALLDKDSVQGYQEQLKESVDGMSWWKRNVFAKSERRQKEKDITSIGAIRTDGLDDLRLNIAHWSHDLGDDHRGGRQRMGVGTWPFIDQAGLALPLILSPPDVEQRAGNAEIATRLPDVADACRVLEDLPLPPDIALSLGHRLPPS